MQVQVQVQAGRCRCRCSVMRWQAGQVADAMVEEEQEEKGSKTEKAGR